ncbi:MAG: hypothetical protein ACRDRH_28885 [Pseudonocardia sp.]
MSDLRARSVTVTAQLRLLDHWERLNRDHFHRRLTRPHIRFATPAVAHALASYTPRRADGRLPKITIDHHLLDGTHPLVDPDAPLDGRWRLTADVLHHEVVHAAQDHLIAGHPHRATHWDHGALFCKLADRVGHTLGLPPVADPHGWPCNRRDPTYYLGALRPWRPGPTDPPTRHRRH